MSIAYSVVPFDDEVNRPELLDWFSAAWGLVIPPDAAPGRPPTLRELYAALDALAALPEIEVRYAEEGAFWQAEIIGPDGQHAFITTLARQGDDAPQHFDYEGDPELLAAVLSRLTPWCGTLLLFQNGEDPVLFL